MRLLLILLLTGCVSPIDPHRMVRTNEKETIFPSHAKLPSGLVRASRASSGETWNQSVGAVPASNRGRIAGVGRAEVATDAERRQAE
jgi:hypothetical protein